jgi:hypothetical protein
MAKTRRAYTGAPAQTTITGALTATTTSITIAANTGWYAGALPLYVVVSPGLSVEEKILVTISGTTLTVVGGTSGRGQDGTSASAHDNGATIYPVPTALDFDEANELTAKYISEGSIVYQGASTFTERTIGTAGQVLKVNSGATAPEWGQVPTAGIADSAVTSAKIADGTIVAGDIADGAITSAKILDGTIATGDLADSAVTSAKIADGTIVAGDLADGAVTSAKILDGTIVAGDIADGAITSAKILDGTIVNADINASAAIALSKLATGALPTTITVASGNIVNGAIVDADISSAAAIESSKLKGNIYILTKSSAQSISNATDTNLTWAYNTELGGLGYTLTSSTYVNIPKDGYYLLSAGATFGANGTGARRIRIWNYTLNDILAEASTAGFTGIDNVLNCSCVAQLDATNQVYVEVYQSSGGSLNVKADKSTFFRVSMLAAYSV